MEKIYVGRSVFEMDHTAKEKLEAYLRDLKESVLLYNAEIDVYEDIESRIEERLSMIKSERIITEEDIDILEWEIGNLDEIFAEEKKKSSENSGFRPLRRNSEKGKFLGVCYGLGKSMDIEPIWIRATLILFTFWIPLITIPGYVIAALAMPEESKVHLTGGALNKGHSKIESGIRKFFDMLYNFGKKVINALK